MLKIDPIKKMLDIMQVEEDIKIAILAKYITLSTDILLSTIKPSAAELDRINKAEDPLIECGLLLKDNEEGIRLLIDQVAELNLAVFQELAKKATPKQIEEMQKYLNF